MRSASLKFKIQNIYAASRVDVVDSGNLSRRLLQAELVAFGALALIYALILGNMVFNIVERRALEKEALAFSNEVGDLELSYLQLAKKVDLELSHALGFQEAKPTYATRKPLGLAPGARPGSDDEI